MLVSVLLLRVRSESHVYVGNFILHVQYFWVLLTVAKVLSAQPVHNQWFDGVLFLNNN